MAFYARKATNLAPNGSFETNATGWSLNGAGTTVARSTAEQAFGAASLLVTTPGSASNEGTMSTNIAVSASTAYVFGVWVKTAATVQLLFQERTAADAFVVNNLQAAFAGSDEWQFKEYPRTTGGTTGNARIGVLTNSAQAVTIYLDGAQLELGTVASGTIHTDGAAKTRAARFGSGHFYAPHLGR